MNGWVFEGGSYCGFKTAICWVSGLEVHLAPGRKNDEKIRHSNLCNFQGMCSRPQKRGGWQHNVLIEQCFLTGQDRGDRLVIS